MASGDLEIKASFGCYLPIDLLEELDERADKEKRSRNNLIEILLRVALDAKIST